MERSIRIAALIFLRWTARFGLRRTSTARKLGISPNTLAKWEQSWKKDRMRLKERGRPAERPGVARRNEIIVLFNMIGPEVGLPTLRAFFPDVPVRELKDIQRRYRDLHRKQQYQGVRVRERIKQFAGIPDQTIIPNREETDHLPPLRVRVPRFGGARPGRDRRLGKHRAVLPDLQSGDRTAGPGADPTRFSNPAR